MHHITETNRGTFRILQRSSKATGRAQIVCHCGCREWNHSSVCDCSSWGRSFILTTLQGPINTSGVTWSFYFLPLFSPVVYIKTSLQTPAVDRGRGQRRGSGATAGTEDDGYLFLQKLEVCVCGGTGGGEGQTWQVITFSNGAKGTLRRKQYFLWWTLLSFLFSD